MQIYKITNLVNGKEYVGKDESSRKRYYGSGKLIVFAIKKYGKENFRKEILFETNNKEVLCEKEKEYIIECNSLSPNGYNLTSGGEGVVPVE